MAQIYLLATADAEPNIGVMTCDTSKGVDGVNKETLTEMLDDHFDAKCRVVSVSLRYNDVDDAFKAKVIVDTDDCSYEEDIYLNRTFLYLEK
jgi:hypothetical protein